MYEKELRVAKEVIARKRDFLTPHSMTLIAREAYEVNSILKRIKEPYYRIVRTKLYALGYMHYAGKPLGQLKRITDDIIDATQSVNYYDLMSAKQINTDFFFKRQRAFKPGFEFEEVIKAFDYGIAICEEMRDFYENQQMYADLIAGFKPKLSRREIHIKRINGNNIQYNKMKRKRNEWVIEETRLEMNVNNLEEGGNIAFGIYTSKSTVPHDVNTDRLREWFEKYEPDEFL